jgi:hypothetical protein
LSFSILKNGPKCRHTNEKLRLIIYVAERKNQLKLNLNKNLQSNKILNPFKRSVKISKLIAWRVMLFKRLIQTRKRRFKSIREAIQKERDLYRKKKTKSRKRVQNKI